MRHEGFLFYGLRSSDEGADTYLRSISFAGLSIILSVRLLLHLPILSAKQPSHVRNTKRTFTEETRTNQPHTKKTPNQSCIPVFTTLFTAEFCWEISRKHQNEALSKLIYLKTLFVRWFIRNVDHKPFGFLFMR